MKTNFQMLKDLLEVYHPQHRGVVTASEKDNIESILHLNEMDVLQLRNLRDFTVLFLSSKEDMESWDKMSAITYVIDNKIFSNGGEV